jgi:hypothetical protein
MYRRTEMDTSNFLKEGDVIEILEGHDIYADVPEHFVYSNRKGCYNITHAKINVSGHLAYFSGKYIVVKTSNDGGGFSGTHGSPTPSASQPGNNTTNAGSSAQIFIRFIGPPHPRG